MADMSSPTSISPITKTLVEHQYELSQMMEMIAEANSLDCAALAEFTSNPRFEAICVAFNITSQSEVDQILRLVHDRLEIIYKEISEYYAPHTTDIESEMVKCDAMIEHYQTFESAIGDAIKLLKTCDINETGLFIKPVFKTIQKPLPWFYGRLNKMSREQITELFTIPRNILVAEVTSMLDWPYDLPTTGITKFFVEPKPADKFDPIRYADHIRAKMRLCFMGNIGHLKLDGLEGSDIIMQIMYRYLKKNRRIRHTRNYGDKTDKEKDITSYTMACFIPSRSPIVPDNIESVIHNVAEILGTAYLKMMKYSYYELIKTNSLGLKLIDIIESAGPEVKMHLYGFI